VVPCNGRAMTHGLVVQPLADGQYKTASHTGAHCALQSYKTAAADDYSREIRYKRPKNVMLRLLEFSRAAWILGLAAFVASGVLTGDQNVQLVASIPFVTACFMESLIGYLRPDLARAEGRSRIQALLSNMSPYRKSDVTKGQRLGLCILMGTALFAAVLLALMRLWLHGSVLR
jgi:hypothetical protein